MPRHPHACFFGLENPQPQTTLQVLQEQLARRGEAAAPMRPLIARMRADVQGRLAFKGQALIRDAVLHYKPSAADLDYPGRVERVCLVWGLLVALSEPWKVVWGVTTSP